MDRRPRPRTLSGASRRSALGLAGLALSASLLLAGSAPARADDAAQLQNLVAALWPQASARGVSRETYERAFRGVRVDQEALQKIKTQPEFKLPLGAYVSSRVSDLRLQAGREKASQYAPILAAIEKFYGVDRYTVLAVWGIETNYGAQMGDHSVIQALATLACCSARAAYFRAELLNALDVLQQGHIDPARMTGSWAGAMGHTQFMPSSFKRYAADGNADGRRDIWTAIPDALASTANYLSEHGWRAGETWGYEVALSTDADLARIRRAGKLRMSDWERLGVRRAGGQGFPRPGDVATLITPAGANGPAFLVLQNFRVIKRYNNSDAYALAVGHLADRLRGGGPFTTPWPDMQQALSSDQTHELQRLLAKRGFEIGEPDGKAGEKTRQAVRAFQADEGLSTDGFASLSLLKRLRVTP